MFCFHCDELTFLRTPELTDLPYFTFSTALLYVSANSQGKTAAWMLGAMQPRKGFFLHIPQQCGCSVTRGGSASCGSGAAAHGADIPALPSFALPSLPCTPPCTRQDFSSPVHCQEL